MCGRYYIEIDDAALREICEEILRKQREQEARQQQRDEQLTIKFAQEPQQAGTKEQSSIKFSGEIFPTNVVPVQIGQSRYEPMQWGFTGFDGKRPVINARSETALEKPMFCHAMRERRCLIPASGYYEWRRDGSKKTKYRLFTPQAPLLFAGCYRQEQDSSLARFVILTRPAAEGLEFIHDRMPVIIPTAYSSAWLYESPDVMEKAVLDLRYQPA